MSTGEHGRKQGPGRVLAGRYRVVAQLGRGGMGVVWRAVDEVLGREVAVKELRTFTDTDGPQLADLRVRMQREARAAARIRHPGVVAVHDVAEEDGRPVIVMELIDGPSLDDVLNANGPMDPREAAGIGARVMEALEAAHQAGVLHRDVKPGNVLLDRGGRVVLTDFGIAAMDDPGDGSTTHLTRSGELVGSLDYLPPERAQGAAPGPPADIWALGATLYAAVEGASPFRRTSTWSTLTAIVADPLPEPRLAGPLFPVLEQLMAKDPELRPDARTAARLLAEVAAGGGTSRPPGVVPAAPQASPPRVPTEVNPLPHRPEGFGPPVADTPAPVVPPGAALTARTAARPDAGRRGAGRSKALLAAGVVAVVLAGGGVTYALTGGGATTPGSELTADGSGGGGAAGEGRRPDHGSAASQSPSGKPGAEGRTGDAEDAGEKGADDKGAGDRKTAPPAGKPTAPGKGGDGSGGAAGGSGGSGADGGTATGGSSTPSGTGGESGTAPACHSIGGGKYNCYVYRTATSYTAAGEQAGVLNLGTNYFFCQQDLGRRETHGAWTNTWWAKTDDDSGNTGVFVSDVYIRGGDNDRPVPGLPLC
ncbi:serine/threonine-protein kinase [Streptomyces liangshanensis]|uniref:serine/threonine-protein kinase n=1 Tax=Streptomyces liangshanensis TaxID=2717324 RepID=UPI0036D826A1